MALLAGVRRLVGNYRLLRDLLRSQQAILAQQQQQTLALQSLAASMRLLVQQQVGAGAGFVTGPADGSADGSGLIRQSEQEVWELLEMEKVLQVKLGRQPLDQEVVAAWEEWRAGG